MTRGYCVHVDHVGLVVATVAASWMKTGRDKIVVAPPLVLHNARHLAKCWIILVTL